jgi:hypothetical protein
MAARCSSSLRLPGRRLRPPPGRYRSPTPLLCYPFLHRVRWREVSPRPGQRPILHSAFRALRNRPKSGFLCRCCKRSSHSYVWVAANSSFGVAAGGPRPKETFATIMIIAGEVEVKRPGKCEGWPPTSVDREARGKGHQPLLSPPTLRRSTPITTTGLAFLVRPGPEGATTLHLIA